MTESTLMPALTDFFHTQQPAGPSDSAMHTLYRAALGGELSLPAMSAIRNADQRSIAMRYLTFDAAETQAIMRDNVRGLLGLGA